MPSLLTRAVTGTRRALWFRPLGLTALIEFTRSIRFFLASGMTLRQAMRVLANKGGSWTVRAVAADVDRELAAGWPLQAALDKQEGRFPPLFLALAAVGEETGNLPEVMKDLENYYRTQQLLQRQFRSQIAFPVLQFVAAVFIVSGLIYILGQLPPARVAGREQPLDPLGMGLVGADGAVRFMVAVFGAVAVILVGLWLLRRLLRRRAVVERFVLALPVVGSVTRAIALTRFSFAMQLMLDSSMSILRTIRLAFAATDNAAFAAASDRAEAVLRRGNSVSTALTESRRFPADYLSAVAVGEESGHLPEVMRQQAEYYDDVSRRGISLLNRLLGVVVWLAVAGFVIFLIIKLFTVMYLGTIEKVAAGR